MSQPTWKLIANLGDSSPLDYGGRFVFVDETGVYSPEVEVVELTDETDGAEQWETRRYPLDRCTYVSGVLSDNPFHPDHAAWFAGSIEQIAATSGTDAASLIADLCGDSATARALAYAAIEQYHGVENFDSYPNQWTTAERAKLEQRYSL